MLIEGVQVALEYEGILSFRRTIAVADLNHDAKLDLAVVEYSKNKVAVLLGNGDGTFRKPIRYSVDDGPVAVTAEDFNSDGKPDLAVSAANGRRLSFLMNSCGVRSRRSRTTEAAI